ncbi:hypothetical protein ATANTOWER_028224 [Ataeniobius toweri]|uniref:Uncharacterized protein n=1 Tax=Ataeniobius toweri TaxID=208326 RepID=A0ABU7AKJ3_9TELE|nr:hypothetical protein [Ataeniobius toweri]
MGLAWLADLTFLFNNTEASKARGLLWEHNDPQVKPNLLQLSSLSAVQTDSLHPQPPTAAPTDAFLLRQQCQGAVNRPVLSGPRQGLTRRAPRAAPCYQSTTCSSYSNLLQLVRSSCCCHQPVFLWPSCAPSFLPPSEWDYYCPCQRIKQKRSQKSELRRTLVSGHRG